MTNLQRASPGGPPITTESREQGRIVLAVDPGRHKCGVAVVSPAGVIARAVVPPGDLPRLLREWVRAHAVTEIVVGDRTGASEVVAAAGPLGLPVRRVDEVGTTQRARARYFAEHPPRGWRRLLPLGLLTPPEPYDDYAAVLIAEAYLRHEHPGT
jgi:RNase H-fold protein (predicted Holliday junction resolvase)